MRSRRRLGAGAVRAVGLAVGLAVAVTVVDGACAPRNPGRLLLDDARHFAEGIRWRRYDDAAAHVLPDDREAFLAEREELDDDLRLDDYEILTAKVGRDRGVVQLQWTWHLDSVGVVYETVVEQTWELHDKYWLVVSERVVRGEPVPGVPGRSAPEGDGAVDDRRAGPGEADRGADPAAPQPATDPADGTQPR